MKVIFTQHISGVAAKGEIRNVKPGFFRNFLLPFQKAVLATPTQLAKWEEVRKQLVIEREQMKEQMEEVKRRIGGGQLTISKKVTAKGTLYGGLHAKDIAEAIASQYKVEVPESVIKAPATIKTVGTYDIALDLGEGVTTHVKVEIVEK